MTSWKQVTDEEAKELIYGSFILQEGSRIECANALTSWPCTPNSLPKSDGLNRKQRRAAAAAKGK